MTYISTKNLTYIKSVTHLLKNNMTEQEVINSVCDVLVNKLYNELDYYMFEHLGYTETNDEYVEKTDEIIMRIIKELTK